ncbi:hypothetical protein HCU64_22790 [Methylobacterium sp. C25]|uniref:hypothetical protein n=1 Tax=Methylobacterium sp. C25 TaxID=2721622 RepID=UPI001F4551DC|nr:hypothetical protein [Methylobacterium sp. C25]MCE4226574.1 hypothetical protein [Methylobacterium sp. C25]
MIGLYFVTCLAANPAHCVTRTHYFDEAVETPIQCLKLAQPAMAGWQNDHEHERWRIERFRCGSPPRDPGSVI